MAQVDEVKETVSRSQIQAEKLTRKGLHKFIRVYKFFAYVSLILSILFAIYTILKISKILNLMSGMESLKIALLFLILSIVARMYYKIFEES